MGQLNINYTEEQMEAVEATILDPQAWIQHAWDNKARQCIDRFVTASGRGSKFTDMATKKQIIKDLKLKKRTV